LPEFSCQKKWRDLGCAVHYGPPVTAASSYLPSMPFSHWIYGGLEIPPVLYWLYGKLM